jgi:hypothetical protein
LEANGVRNGIAFLHIPLPEYTKAAPASLADLRERTDLGTDQVRAGDARVGMSLGSTDVSRKQPDGTWFRRQDASGPAASQPTCFGMRQDGISPFDDRGGLFDALKAEANVHATFVGHGKRTQSLQRGRITFFLGHEMGRWCSLSSFSFCRSRRTVPADHGNDWCCKYQGVWLCFGRHR